MKISVLTPSYNSGKYVQRAIESVASQDYDNWEHIIMDGGSTDGSTDIFKKYSHLEWESQPDRGQSDAMNKAFNRCTGDIIVYLNADDFFEPGIFSKVAAHFKKASGDILVGNLNVLNEHNELRYIQQPGSNLVDILDLVNLQFPMNPVCYFYKRDVQQVIGSFPLNNHFTMDYWFLLRVYKQFKVDRMDVVFGNFFHSGDNKSSSYVNAKEGLFRTLLDFLIENNSVEQYKDFIIKGYTSQLSMVVDLREQNNSLKRSLRATYANLWVRIGRKAGLIKIK